MEHLISLVHCFFVIDDEGKEIPFEGDLPDLVIFTKEAFIGNKNDKIILPLAIISSFCLAVIKNSFNKNLFIPYGAYTRIAVLG